MGIFLSNSGFTGRFFYGGSGGGAAVFFTLNGPLPHSKRAFGKKMEFR